MEMTLLDQVLQMIIDYISLINDCPEAFPLGESQQKEFNGWKQEILQHLCLIIYQVTVSLNIARRKLQSPE